MKRPKKLTRRQKVKLSKKGYNAEDYLLLEENTDTFTAIARYPDEDGNKKTVTLNK